MLAPEPPVFASRRSLHPSVSLADLLPVMSIRESLLTQVPSITKFKTTNQPIAKAPTASTAACNMSPGNMLIDGAALLCVS